MDFFGYPVCKEEYAQRLREMIAEKTAFVVSTTYCSYCNKAKSLLDRNKIEHSEILLDTLNANDQMEISNCIYGRNPRYVPIVFLKGEQIGGYGELMQMQSDGSLQSKFGPSADIV
ncbi:glutaredoxin 3 [Stylonychia lemnae]|uniref:Glutaredoxin 3 n=1 Tax=Stylonychia lemnae TaxID=5949 RepID=A0A078B432_STYLE|nr:glutaredoxin 3 [Stylonychia lemnae]|eukprot:CDW87952.1 glutaredoxin 3 [Stylonychia lemnae]